MTDTSLAESVDINGTLLDDFTIIDATHVSGVSYASGDINVYDIGVTFTGLGRAYAVGGWQFYPDTPQVFSVDRPIASLNGTVNISGEGFMFADDVRFMDPETGDEFTGITVIDDNTINATIPSSISSSFNTALDVYVINPFFNNVGFGLITVALPVPSSCSPDTVAADGTQSTEIDGLGFTDTQTVQFGLGNFQTFVVSNDGVIEVSNVVTNGPTGGAGRHRHESFGCRNDSGRHYVDLTEHAEDSFFTG